MNYLTDRYCKRYLDQNGFKKLAVLIKMYSIFLLSFSENLILSTLTSGDMHNKFKTGENLRLINHVIDFSIEKA